MRLQLNCINLGLMLARVSYRGSEEVRVIPAGIKYRAWTDDGDVTQKVVASLTHSSQTTTAIALQRARTVRPTADFPSPSGGRL